VPGDDSFFLNTENVFNVTHEGLMKIRELEVL
jgi:hypothetical protein